MLWRIWVCTLRCTSRKLVVVNPAVMTSIDIRNRVRRRTRGNRAPTAVDAASPDMCGAGSEDGLTELTHELISHSVHRTEVDRARGVFLQFLAEFQDMVIHGASGRIVLVSPNLVQQF